MSSILVETHSRTPPLEVKITIQFWLYYYIEYAFPISITKKDILSTFNWKENHYNRQTTGDLATIIHGSCIN